MEGNVVKMSTGVKLRVSDVPIMAIEAIKAKWDDQRPQAPVHYIVEKDREEVNTSDPDYLVALERWEAKMNVALIDAAIYLGCRIESIPEGIPEPEGEWCDRFTRLGIEIPQDKEGRFLAWVKYMAAPTAKDLNTISNMCARAAGVPEEDVAKAAPLFQNRTQRRADRKAHNKA